MRRILLLSVWLPILLLAISSCRYYRRDIILQMDDPRDNQYLATVVKKAEANYRIAKNDNIEFSLFTNGGELLIDPNAELSQQLNKLGATSGGARGAIAAGGTTARPKYLVSDSGDVLLPMVGKVKVDSLTIRQVDSLLAKKYATFYNNCFVQSSVENRRCFLFSSGGGGVAGGLNALTATPSLTGKVVKLQYEKVHLLEVLAEAGSIGLYSKLDRVRIIRGNLQKPEVIVVDLSHIYTMAQKDLTILPYDIIYIEPGRRPTLDFVREVSTIGNLFIGTFGLVYLLIATANR